MGCETGKIKKRVVEIRLGLCGALHISGDRVRGSVPK